MPEGLRLPLGETTMSRWSKRSTEEKERILREQRGKAQEAHVRNTFDGSEDRALKIYEEHELPLLCVRHGWVASEQYVIVNEVEPITHQRMPTLKGVCPHCARPVKRYLYQGSMAALMDMALISTLLREGRLKDNR